MAANTSKRDIVASLASLNANAIDLINKGKRSQEMVQVLLEALQFFKENRLGSATPNPDPAVALDQKRRREQFRRRNQSRFVDMSGDKDEVPLAVLKFSMRTSANAMQAGSGCPNYLRDLVKMTEDRVYQVMGLHSLNELRELLKPYGMYFGMTEEHILEAFGEPIKKSL